MLVSVEDFQSRLGRTLTGVDLERALFDLEDAEALVTGLFRVTDPPQPLVLTLISRVALRSFRNPHGITQESLGSRSVTYSDAERKPGVYVTPEELAWPLPRLVRSSVYSVPLTTPADRS